MKRVKHSSTITDPKWYNLIFTGREGDDGGEGGASGDEGGQSTDDGGEGAEEGGEGKGESEKDDNSGLKSALQKERQQRKDLERENRKLKAAQEEKELADKSEVERATAAEKKAAEKVAALAEQLLTTSLDNAITKAAQAAKFRDVDDALALINRKEITFEQDEDNPADIDIDAKSIERAVKALAAKKPHLILGDGDETPSGGKFNGGRKDQSKTDEAALKAKYPSLG